MNPFKTLISLLFSISLLQTINSMALEEQKISIVTCKSEYCENSLLQAFNTGCSGQYCLQYISLMAPVCKICIDEIKDKRFFETFNDGTKRLPCFQNDRAQLTQCKIMCRLNFQNDGSCILMERRNDFGTLGDIMYCACTI